MCVYLPVVGRLERREREEEQYAWPTQQLYDTQAHTMQYIAFPLAKETSWPMGFCLKFDDDLTARHQATSKITIFESLCHAHVPHTHTCTHTTTTTAHRCSNLQGIAGVAAALAGPFPTLRINPLRRRRHRHPYPATDTLVPTQTPLRQQADEGARQ